MVLPGLNLGQGQRGRYDARSSSFFSPEDSLSRGRALRRCLRVTSLEIMDALLRVLSKAASLSPHDTVDVPCSSLHDTCILVQMYLIPLLAAPGEATGRSIVQPAARGHHLTAIQCDMVRVIYRGAFVSCQFCSKHDNENSPMVTTASSDPLVNMASISPWRHGSLVAPMVSLRVYARRNRVLWQDTDWRILSRSVYMIIYR